MEKWDGFKIKLRKFAREHNLRWLEDYHDADVWVFNFKCSDISEGFFSINFTLRENEPMVLAQLTVYDFGSDLSKEKNIFKNVKKPKPFDEDKFLIFLKDLLTEMVNFKGDDFDLIHEIQSHPMMASKEDRIRILKGLPVPIL